MSYLKITTSVSKQSPNQVCQKIINAIEQAYQEKDPEAHVQINCTFKEQELCITGQVFSEVELDLYTIAKTELDKFKEVEERVYFHPQLVKYKYLHFLPKPKQIDKRCYDLVGEDEFFEIDGRIPLVLATKFGIYPTKGHYEGKPTKHLNELEGLENRTIAIAGMVYLSGFEYPGLMTTYVDEYLIKTLKKDKTALSTALWTRHN